MIVYAPALISLDRLGFLVPVAKYFVKTTPKGPDDFVDKSALARLWSYEVNPLSAAHELFRLTALVRRNLSRITLPVLAMHSYGDRMIDYRSSQIVHDEIASAEKELIFLEGCGHVLTLDVQWPAVAQHSVDFVQRHRAKT
ncbi:MAG: alpha/beta hydrolase [Caldilineaceae bacterium]